MKQLGAAIKQARHEHRWSQKDLAERLDLARPTVTNWELDKHQPRRICLRALEQLLGMRFIDNNGGGDHDRGN